MGYQQLICIRSKLILKGSFWNNGTASQMDTQRRGVMIHIIFKLTSIHLIFKDNHLFISKIN